MITEPFIGRFGAACTRCGAPSDLLDASLYHLMEELEKRGWTFDEPLEDLIYAYCPKCSD